MITFACGDQKDGYLHIWLSTSSRLHVIIAGIVDVSSSLQGGSGQQLDIYIAFEVAIATLAFLNNSLVLAAIIKYKHLHTGTCRLVASLACADMGVALLAIPSGIVLRQGFLLSLNTSGNDTSSGNSQSITISLCFVSVSFALIFTQVSIFNLLAIGFDRYLSMYYSLRYKAIVTSTRVKVCIAIIWILGMVIGLVPQADFFIDQLKSNETSHQDLRCTFEEIINMKIMVFLNSIFCMFLPLVIMLILYTLVFKSANEQLRKIYSDVLLNQRKSKVSLLSIKEFWKLQQKSADSKPNPMRRMRNPLRCVKRLVGRKSCDNDVELSCDYCMNDATNRGDWLESVEEKRKSNLVISLIHPENAANAKEDSTSAASDSPSYSNSPSMNLLDVETTHFFTRKQSESLCESSFHPPTEELKTFSALEERQRKHSSASVATSNSSTGTCEADIKKKRIKRKWKFIQKEIRAARSLSTTVGVFALCWLPLHIHNVLVYFKPEIGEHQPTWLIDVGILLSHANSMVNPIIYAFHLRDIRTSFRKMFNPLKKFLISALHFKSKKLES